MGPVCESGDFLALKRKLPQAPEKGDLLAVMDVGAYGMAMSSNYNMRGRAAEVLVDGASWQLIRRREDFDSLIRTMTDLWTLASSRATSATWKSKASISGRLVQGFPCGKGKVFTWSEFMTLLLKWWFWRNLENPVIMHFYLEKI